MGCFQAFSQQTDSTEPTQYQIKENSIRTFAIRALRPMDATVFEYVLDILKNEKQVEIKARVAKLICRRNDECHA